MSRPTVQECWALEAKLRPGFDELVLKMKMPELKQFAKLVIANTRGCMVKADYLRAIEQRWRTEVWDIAGYNPPAMRTRPMFYPGLLTLPSDVVPK